MACEDLRHVCGGCGFRWPERSAYDELTFENARLRDELDAATGFEFTGPNGTWWVRPLNAHGIWTIGKHGWVGGERFTRDQAISKAQELAGAPMMTLLRKETTE